MCANFKPLLFTAALLLTAAVVTGAVVANNAAHHSSRVKFLCADSLVRAHDMSDMLFANENNSGSDDSGHVEQVSIAEDTLVDSFVCYVVLRVARRHRTSSNRSGVTSDHDRRPLLRMSGAGHEHFRMQQIDDGSVSLLLLTAPLDDSEYSNSNSNSSNNISSSGGSSGDAGSGGRSRIAPVVQLYALTLAKPLDCDRPGGDSFELLFGDAQQSKRDQNKEQKQEYNDDNSDDEDLHQSRGRRLRIVVTDVNDNAPVFDQSEFVFELTENNGSSNGSTTQHNNNNSRDNVVCVGDVLAHDLDPGVNGRVKYSLMQSTLRAFKNVDDENHNNGENHRQVKMQPIRLTSAAAVTAAAATAQKLLRLDEETGRVCVLAALLDRESIAAYTFEVSASDSATVGPPRLSNRTALVRLNVLDINDNRPIFYQQQQQKQQRKQLQDTGADAALATFYLEEREASQSFVAWLKAFDLDEGDNGRIDYSLELLTNSRCSCSSPLTPTTNSTTALACVSGAGVANHLFTVDANGIVRTAATFEIDSKASFTAHFGNASENHHRALKCDLAVSPPLHRDEKNESDAALPLLLLLRVSARDRGFPTPLKSQLNIEIRIVRSRSAQRAATELLNLKLEPSGEADDNVFLLDTDNYRGERNNNSNNNNDDDDDDDNEENNVENNVENDNDDGDDVTAAKASTAVAYFDRQLTRIVASMSGRHKQSANETRRELQLSFQLMPSSSSSVAPLLFDESLRTDEQQRRYDTCLQSEIVKYFTIARDGRVLLTRTARLAFRKRNSSRVLVCPVRIRALHASDQYSSARMATVELWLLAFSGRKTLSNRTVSRTHRLIERIRDVLRHSSSSNNGNNNRRAANESGLSPWWEQRTSSSSSAAALLMQSAPSADEQRASSSSSTWHRVRLLLSSCFDFSLPQLATVAVLLGFATTLSGTVLVALRRARRRQPILKHRLVVCCCGCATKRTENAAAQQPALSLTTPTKTIGSGNVCKADRSSSACSVVRHHDDSQPKRPLSAKTTTSAAAAAAAAARGDRFWQTALRFIVNNYKKAILLTRETRKKQWVGSP